MELAITEGTESCAEEDACEEYWTQVQESLRRRLVTEDDFAWRLPTASPAVAGKAAQEECLRYVGGVDVSYSRADSTIACAALVVLDLQTLEIVYDDFSIAALRTPYVPGFLAFREAPIILEVFERLKTHSTLYYPQLLMVDGNGMLHPRGFGLACHLGVLANIPTIGIAKNLHHVDGLTRLEVRQFLDAKQCNPEDIITLTGSNRQTLGVAFRCAKGSMKPIFVSIGHRVSLTSAIEIVQMTCKYRVPEPIRQADMRSKALLQQHLTCSSGQNMIILA